MGRHKKYILTPALFDEVIQLVKSGFTIEKAVRKINFSTASFYGLINSEQKILLQQAKASMAIHGTKISGGYSQATEAFPANFDYALEDEE